MSKPSLADLPAVILAGGLGTRLRSAVADRPKVLAEVAGRPFLAYLLDQLAAVGVQRAVLCTGYQGEQVQQVFGDEYAGMRLIYSRESSPLGTGGCLRLAAPLLDSPAVLALNGDSYCGVDLAALVAGHRRRDANATLVVTHVADTRRFGRVELAEDDTIQGFAEKGGMCQPGWINAGIYLVSRQLLLDIPEARPVSLEREVFPRWIGQGFFGCRSSGPFSDIGTPESYRDAERLFGGDNRTRSESGQGNTP